MSKRRQGIGALPLIAALVAGCAGTSEQVERVQQGVDHAEQQRLERQHEQAQQRLDEVIDAERQSGTP